MAAADRYGRFSVREFLVDLLGSLVPGVLFTFLAFFSLLWPIWALTREIQRAAPISYQIIEQITKFGSAFRFELLGLLLVSSYVVGSFFFRQDPKEPDRDSYRYISRSFKPEEKQTWPVREDADGKLDVQFPYRYLREYLEARELNHLALLVPWSGTGKDTHHRRTKTFINTLKIRLLFFFPQKCGEITRNEAHIRLMSSVWYASRSLVWVGLVGIAIGLAAALLGFSNNGTLLPQYVLPILVSASLLPLAFWVRTMVARFLHYQRVREIIFVLETAFNAAQERPSILDDLY